MSRTRRIAGYEKGRCIMLPDGQWTRFWARHECVRVRKDLNRSYRRKNKQFVKRFGETLPYSKTRGWITW